MYIIVVYGLLNNIQTKKFEKNRPEKFYARGVRLLRLYPKWGTMVIIKLKSTECLCGSFFISLYLEIQDLSAKWGYNGYFQIEIL